MAPGLRHIRHSCLHIQEHMKLGPAAPFKGMEDVLPHQALELELGSWTMKGLGSQAGLDRGD